MLNPYLLSKLGTLVYLEEDADAQVHEGLGEVDDALPSVVDGHGPHSQVCFLHGGTVGLAF